VEEEEEEEEEGPAVNLSPDEEFFGRFLYPLKTRLTDLYDAARLAIFHLHGGAESMSG